jgi:ABC-type tungstate transport system permease subunit
MATMIINVHQCIIINDNKNINIDYSSGSMFVDDMMYKAENKSMPKSGMLLM